LYNAKNNRRKEQQLIKLYGICSEVQSKANQALREWNLKNFTSIVGDNDNVVAQSVQKKYLPHLHITTCPPDAATRSPMNQTAYPNGAVQPAILIFVGRDPILAWAVQPRASNLQGSLRRPEPAAVGELVEEALSNKEEDGKRMCSNGKDLRQVGMYGNLCRHYLCGCAIL